MRYTRSVALDRLLRWTVTDVNNSHVKRKTAVEKTDLCEVCAGCAQGSASEVYFGSKPILKKDVTQR
jgi:hypothetical protein